MVDYSMIEKLRHICPTVDNYLNQELYLMDVTEDQVTPQYILNECYLLTLDELKSLGIYPNDDDGSTLLEDLYTAEILYYIRHLFDTKTMYDLLRFDHNFRDFLDHLLHDHHGDSSELIWKILEYLEEKFPNNSEILRCAHMAMEFHSKDAFKQHLLAILKIVVPVNDNPLHNIKDITPYLKKQITIRQKLKEIVSRLTVKFKELDVDYLNQVVNDYDGDKLLPDNVHQWALYDILKKTHSESEMPLEFQRIKEKHEKETKHHLNYYLTHNIQPTKENLVELILHIYNDNELKSDYFKELEEMISQAKSHEIITDDDEDLLTRYSSVLYI